MSKYTFFYIFIAIVSGVSLQLNWISNASISSKINSTEIIFRILLAPIPVWILMKFIDYIINTIVKSFNIYMIPTVTGRANFSPVCPFHKCV